MSGDDSARPQKARGDKRGRPQPETPERGNVRDTAAVVTRPADPDGREQR